MYNLIITFLDAVAVEDGGVTRRTGFVTGGVVFVAGEVLVVLVAGTAETRPVGAFFTGVEVGGDTTAL